MNLQVGSHVFDDVYYDRAADVLYLSKGEPEAAADSRETAEGHVVRLDSAGEVIGITLISPRGLLSRDGRIVVTLPEPVEPDPEQVEAAILGIS
jgi:uncharacterized protein YuzE